MGYYGGSGGTSGGASFTDDFSLNIKGADTNNAPTDNTTFAMTLTQSDTNTAPTDALQLSFPAPDFADSNVVPSDTKSFLVKFWLTGSAGTGVTNPSNADGSNNGTVATLQTAPAGTNPLIMTSTLGGNVPTVTISSVVFRGFFKSVNTLVTSTTTLTLHSSSALFSDVVMFTNNTLNNTVDHLSGDFTFDLLANGINTLAKIQSVQLVCKTQDAIAGTTPAVLTVDAGSLEIQGAFT